MQEVLHLINGMSPYLLLGFLLAGLIHAFVPSRYFHKYLSRKSFRSVLNAALLGIPLPLCSCGVIPTAMSLRKEGTSKGAVTSFLIATPQTGIDSIIATFSLMGLPFAVIRPISAFLIAICGGFLVDKMDKETVDSDKSESSKGKCCCSNKAETHEHSCQCHGDHHHEGHVCNCHGDHEHSHETHACSCHGDKSSGIEQKISEGFYKKLKSAIKYAYVDMMEDIGKWLVVGLLLAGLITIFIPTEYFSIFHDNTITSMFLVLCISIPMYLCATGSIPIAVALMMKGLTPGAALVLLMAGPACNFASMLVIRKVMGVRTMVHYIASIVLGSIVMGCAIDWLQFSGTVDFLYQLRMEETCCSSATPLWQWACTVLLCLLLVNAILLPMLGLRKKKCCHCH